MSGNSIKNAISAEDIISEIRLLLSADIERKQAIIVVEGDDDGKILKKLVSSKVDIIESFSGKIGVNDIVRYFTDETRVIGIRDRDYDNIEEFKKIFFYDYSCLEMMIVSYSELFESIYYEYYRGELEVGELLGVILNSIKHISMLRKLNTIKDYEVNFRGISISNIINNYSMDIDNLMIEIKKRNSKFSSDFIDQLEQELSIEVNAELDNKMLLNITQGHDFIDAFHHYCKRNKGKEASKEDIASSLRCSFNKNHFSKTDLHKELNSYENKINIDIIRRN